MSKSKKIIAGTMLAGALGIGLAYAAQIDWSASTVEVTNKKENKQQQAPSYEERVAGKVKETKWQVVDKIQECESAGHTEEDAPIVHDSNSKISVGVLQWQVASVQHYVKKWHGRDITRKEAVILALDAERARVLAYKTIWYEVGGVWNWRSCAEAKGVAATIETIRTIEGE